MRASGGEAKRSAWPTIARFDRPARSFDVLRGVATECAFGPAATINRVGKTSMDVGIRVIAENHRTRVQRHVMSCFFVMIAMTDDGEPTEVASFVPATDEEKRRWNQAEQRRALRR